MMHRQTTILKAADNHQRCNVDRNEAISDNSQYRGREEKTDTPAKDFLESIHAKRGMPTLMSLHPLFINSANDIAKTIFFVITLFQSSVLCLLHHFWAGIEIDLHTAVLGGDCLINDRILTAVAGNILELAGRDSLRNQIAAHCLGT